MNEYDANPLFAYFSKQEVTENFSLAELLNFARQGDLQKWLDENFYDSDALKLAMILKRAPTDADLKLVICEAFDLPLENLSGNDAADIAEAADALNQKLLLTDDRYAVFVRTQSELVKAVRGGAQVINLCGGEFRIPLNRGGMTYIGSENALIEIDTDDDLDLDEREIVLENLQIYIRRPIVFRAEHSRNLKILDGSKKSLQSDVSTKEILSVLRGRGKFESPEDFKQRAEIALDFMRAAEPLPEQRGWDLLPYMVFVEQRWLAMCAELCGVEVHSLSDLPELFGGKQKTFTHVWGYKKFFRENRSASEKFCRDCANRIAHDFPQQAEKFSRLAATRNYFAG